MFREQRLSLFSQRGLLVMGGGTNCTRNAWTRPGRGEGDTNSHRTSAHAHFLTVSPLPSSPGAGQRAGRWRRAARSAWLRRCWRRALCASETSCCGAASPHPSTWTCAAWPPGPPCSAWCCGEGGAGRVASGVWGGVLGSRCRALVGEVGWAVCYKTGIEDVGRVQGMVLFGLGKGELRGDCTALYCSLWGGYGEVRVGLCYGNSRRVRGDGLKLCLGVQVGC